MCKEALMDVKQWPVHETGIFFACVDNRLNHERTEGILRKAFNITAKPGEYSSDKYFVPLTWPGGNDPHPYYSYGIISAENALLDGYRICTTYAVFVGHTDSCKAKRVGMALDPEVGARLFVQMYKRLEIRYRDIFVGRPRLFLADTDTKTSLPIHIVPVDRQRELWNTMEPLSTVRPCQHGRHPMCFLPSFL